MPAVLFIQESENACDNAIAEAESGKQRCNAYDRQIVFPLAAEIGDPHVDYRKQDEHSQGKEVSGLDTGDRF